jgi:hypothetical protein
VVVKVLLGKGGCIQEDGSKEEREREHEKSIHVKDHQTSHTCLPSQV